MLECPVCRREFDASFQVFAAPSRESYDTVDCARRAARSNDAAQAFLAPTLLPTIELLPLARLPAADPPAILPVRSRRRLAAAIAVPLVASPAAVAAGLSLVAAGTATSVYLWSPALEGGGRVVAAPAAPAQSASAGDAAGGLVPDRLVPPSGGPVDQAREEDASETAKVVALTDTQASDGLPQIENDISDATAQTAGAAPSSPHQGTTTPTQSHSGPTPHGNTSPPHGPSPAPVGPASHPVTPPPRDTTPPNVPTGTASPPPPTTPAPPPPSSAPPSHGPHSVPTVVGSREPEEPSKGNKPKPKPKPKHKPKPPSAVATPPDQGVPPTEGQSDAAAGDPGSEQLPAGDVHGNADQADENENGNGNGRGNGKKP